MLAREDIKIIDIAPIVRGVDGQRDISELANRQWSWPSPSGKPIYNFRSEDRDFTSGRCLVPADDFYEFEDPVEAGQKRKTKWLFTLKNQDWFCIAGIWRYHLDVGEVFIMLTMQPGDDVAPCHHRPIIPLPRDRWAAWVNPAIRRRMCSSLFRRVACPPRGSSHRSRPSRHCSSDSAARSPRHILLLPMVDSVAASSIPWSQSRKGADNSRSVAARRT